MCVHVRRFSGLKPYAYAEGDFDVIDGNIEYVQGIGNLVVETEVDSAEGCPMIADIET